MSTKHYNMPITTVDKDGNPCIIYPKTKTSNIYNVSGQSLDTIITNLNTAINGKADDGHNHDNTYLKLSGGTLTGQLKSRNIVPSSSLSYSLGSSSYRYSTGYINKLYTTGGSVRDGNECAVNGDQVSTAIDSELNDGNEKDHFHLFDALGISTENSIMTFGNPIMHLTNGSSSINEFSFYAHRDRIYLVFLSIIRYESASLGGSTMYFVRGKCTWLGFIYWLPFVGNSTTPVITKLHVSGHYRYSQDQAMDLSSYMSITSTSTLDYRNEYGTIELSCVMASAGAGYMLGTGTSGVNISTYGMAIPVI